MSKTKVLIIGPYPPPLGGVTVECYTLTSCLREFDEAITVDQFNTNLSTLGLLQKFCSFIFKVLKADSVFVYGSHRGVCLFGIFFVPLCKIARKRCVVKITGGNLWEYFQSANSLFRVLLNMSLFRANAMLLETKSLVRNFQEQHSNIYWFPMTRIYSDVGNVTINEKSKLRVVYLGHINEPKGVLLLLEAADKLKNICIDAFGEFVAKDGRQLSEETFRGRKVTYRGVVQPEELSSVLSEYDVLVLPTQYIGEGYPGVIIEAKRAGLAVITTRWRSIPEIVKHNFDGLLVEPGNLNELASALSQLNSDRKHLTRLKQGSRDSFANFDSRIWCRSLIKHLVGSK